MVDLAPRKIAVLRANGLGDFMLATPALRALAKGFPAAQITFLTHPWLLGFIAGRYPYLHRVEATPLYPKINEPGRDDPPPAESAEAFFARMRAERFDLAVQMQGGGRESNPFVAALGAAHTLGLVAPGCLALEHNLRYYYYQHEIIRYLELVGRLGIPWDGLEMDLPLLAGDWRRLARVWRPAGKRYAVLHVGAGDVRRRWPLESFARVAESIGRKGYTVVLTGSAAERGLTARLRQLVRRPLVDLAARLDLGALAALLSGASLMVSNDTGPAHMACALNVPSVVIYWCGNVITAGPLKRERLRPVLSWTLRCPRCGSEHRCACQASWVGEVTADEVLAEVDDLLASEAH